MHKDIRRHDYLVNLLQSTSRRRSPLRTREVSSRFEQPLAPW
jgi:hypothetical protein